jgi:hypothetical protein
MRYQRKSRGTAPGKSKVRACTGTEALHRPGVALRVGRGIALLFLYHGTRRG